MAKAKVLSKDEIKRVMRIADTGRNGLRDRVALSLSILAGMRILNISSTGSEKKLDKRSAICSDGSYLSASMEIIVCLETSIAPARSAWVIQIE